MHHIVDKIFAKWGSEMLLEKGGIRRPFRALLQHSGSKSWQNMQKQFSPIGRVSTGQYVFIGPAEPSAATGDMLVMDGVVYELRRVESVKFGNKIVYRWGLCVKMGGDSQ